MGKRKLEHNKINMGKTLIYATLAIILLFSVQAKDLFIDVDGVGGACDNARNRAANSITTPWCDLDANDGEILSGDTVYFRAGEYFGEQDYQGNTITYNITLTNYNNEVVWLSTQRDTFNTTCTGCWVDYSNATHAIWGNYTFPDDTSNRKIWLNHTTPFFTWNSQANFDTSPYDYNNFYDSGDDSMNLSSTDLTFNPNTDPIYVMEDQWDASYALHIISNTMNNDSWIIVDGLIFGS